jgi:hypothetical protein
MTSVVVVDRPVTEDGPPPDPEVLIREARRRTRRRRMGWTAALGTVVLGVLAGLIAIHRGAAKPKPVTPSSPVTVNARAFQGHGTLAFVSKGSLYVLDGATGRLVHLGDGGHTASDPRLSADGRWLAYLEQVGPPSPDAAGSSHGGDGAYQLWIARANGSDAHRVASAGNSEMVGWSPTRDVLAVIKLPPQDWTCRSAPTTSVSLVTPAGALRSVYALHTTCADPRHLYGAAWSPDGGSLAIGTTDFRRSGGSRIFAIDLATGARRTWFSIRTTHHFPGACGSSCISDEVVADPAGWWPKRGIGFWIFGSGMSANNDGSPLELIRAPGAKPTKLGVTLSDGTDTAVAASPAGELAIVRAPWRDVGTGGTEVQVCAASAALCRAIPGASVWNRAESFRCHAHHPYTYCYPQLKPGSGNSGVTVDPAWSPSGSLLAYARGPAVPQDATPTGQWLDQHQLFVYNPATGTTRRLSGTEGASAPQWSSDGRSILYVSHDSLWLLNLKSGGSARIAGPLFGGTSFTDAYNANNYYHQVPFTAQFGWRS